MASPWRRPVVPSGTFQAIDSVGVLRQRAVDLVGDWLQPFVADIRAGGDEGNVGEPGVGLCAVPVLGPGLDADHGAGLHADGVLAFGLVPAAACRTQQDLVPPAFGAVVDVPVVAASR